ncbi:MAG TPA: tetratricopeptide repeat protein [Saprospiraceae bacterium]|nr:tetratricopeptide repeat protein [Saprospiraceae bacterium]
MNHAFRFPLSCLALFLSPLLVLAQQMPPPQTSAADTIAYVLKYNKDYVRQCDALYSLGTYYWGIGQPENALLAMNQSKAIAEKNNYPKGMYDAYAIIGATYLKQGDFPKVRSIYRECLQLAQHHHNEYGANRANYLLANMYLQLGLMDSVIVISKAVLDAPHMVYDSVTLPKFNAFLGNAYMARGDLQSAMKCYLDALAIAEKIVNETVQMVCLGNLANINNSLRNYKEAIAYQRRAFEIAVKNNQAEQVANSFLSIGASYRDQLILDSAAFYFRRSVQWFTIFGYRQGIAIATSDLGATMMQLNQIDSGMYYLRVAKAEFISLNDSFNIASTALLMGSMWRVIPEANRSRSKMLEALKEFLTCQAITEHNKLNDLRMNCYRELCLLHEALGNETEAFNYLKRYTNLSDTIRSQQYTKQMAEMQTKYESEKKETEIAKLNAEKLLGVEKISHQRVLNYSLLAMAGLILASGSVVFRNVQKKRVAEQQVAVLEKQNAIESMRTKIASDVHDEMGANLTRLGLNAQQLLQDPAIPPKGKQLVEKMALQSKDIITGMREIIWASNPANDNLKSMLGFMRQYIDRFFDGTNIRPLVNFPHDVGEVTLHPEVRRNLFLILKESLNNAVKYSGSDRIDIDFRNENESFNLNIKDYGKGIDDQNQDAFSNGLHNMKMRADLIHSFFKLITAPGQGVQISVEGKLY